jgi:hypothetical protein
MTATAPAVPKSHEATGLLLSGLGLRAAAAGAAAALGAAAELVATVLAKRRPLKRPAGKCALCTQQRNDRVLLIIILLSCINKRSENLGGESLRPKNRWIVVFGSARFLCSPPHNVSCFSQQKAGTFSQKSFMSSA